jgi:HNH endonuclease
MNNFLPSLPTLQILWDSDPGWELECINTRDLPPGEAYTVAIGFWSGRKHYYRYPISVKRTADLIVISEYRRPPEWATSAGWEYVKGRLTISLSRAGVPETVAWTRDGSREVSTLEPGKEWQYFASEVQVATPEPRGRIQVEKIDRPLQALMRKMLLATQGRCVISGCEVECCLEAAHLLPVKNGGKETPENMVLLRADLHRLYDAGLLSLRISSGVFQVFAAEEVHEYVKQAAKHKVNPSQQDFTVAEPWAIARLKLQPSTNHRRVDA